MQVTVRVLAALALLGRDQTWLMRASRLGSNTIHRFLYEYPVQPTERIFERVATTLGVDPSWLVRDPGFNRPLTDTESAELEHSVRLLRRLISGERSDARVCPNAQKIPASSISQDLRRRGARVVCQIKGDSMTDAGLRDGDMAYIKPEAKPRDVVGALVLVQLNRAHYLKLLRVEARGVITLYSASAGYEPIRIAHGDDFQLLGRVLSTVRRYE